MLGTSGASSSECAVFTLTVKGKNLMFTYHKVRTTMRAGLAFAALACALWVLAPASVHAGGKPIAGFSASGPLTISQITSKMYIRPIPLGGMNRRPWMVTPSRPLGDTRGEVYRRTFRSNDLGHVRYRLVDMGTLGGGFSALEGLAKVLTNGGTVAAYSETSVPNPYYPNFMYWAGQFTQDQHGFASHNGAIYDLGTLPGGSSSITNWINERNDIAGVSDNGIVDPISGLLEGHAVLWSDRRIIDLGTLGGYQSIALGLNDEDQVVGVATNTVPDSVDFFGFGAQERAFIWDRGVMHDLGTLGGPDAIAYDINDSGQVMGQSYTSTLANHPFFWEHGKMTDIGSFGGTFSNPEAFNNRGQVAGLLSLPGDINYHPFLWDRGKLTDLGTFGGNSGEAKWMNDAGQVVGSAQTPIVCTGGCEEAQVYHEFLWSRGILTDLGQLPGTRCGVAFGINESGQVVGTNGICHGGIDATIWERGSLQDLNDLIPANSSLHLVYATQINDCGEIAGTGVPPGVSVYDVGTKGHVYLLIPLRGEGEHARYDSQCGDDQRFRQYLHAMGSSH